MVSLSLRAKGFLVGTLLALVLLMAGIFTYAASAGASQAGRDIHRQLQLRDQIQRLKTSETDASSQAWAYSITGDEGFAGRVRGELAEFDSTMETLAQLTSGVPEQRARLSEIAAIERSRVERLFDGFAKYRSGLMTKDALARTVISGEDQRLKMAARIDALAEDGKRFMETSLDRMERLRGIMKICVWVGFATAGASGMIIWLMFAVGIRHRIRDLKASLAGLGGDQYVALQARDPLKVVCDGLVRVAERLGRKNQVLENAFDGIARVDRAGNWSLNRMGAEVLSLTERGPGANIFNLVPREDRPALDQAVARMRAEGRGEAQVRVLKSDGSLLDLALVLSAENEGGFVVFLRDNSLQKNAEAALVRAKDAAVSSNVAKTRFLAKIGHEIRTPLNAILGSADLLAETSLNSDQSEYVSIFRRNSRRLVTLINDFLDFSKIEAGAVRVDKVPFRIRQALYDVVETFRDVASRKGLLLDAQIDPDVPEWQVGDGHRLQQVLTNLVSNATKFTTAGGVALRASVVAAEDRRRLRFEVSDTGAGISISDREKIFTPFTQIKDPGAPTQGTGLGLTICRELVELMNGSIGVDSQEGIGSVFYFELPLEVSDAPTSIPADSFLSDSQAPAARTVSLTTDRLTRILIAEDTADNRLLLQAYLKDQPVTLRFAENGKEVMNVLSSGEVFDLIFMDLDMPVVDGCAAARWTRAWQAQKKITQTPIVALSAHAMYDMVRSSLDAGCVAHVAKPVDRRTLIETIARYALPGPARPAPACQPPERESMDARQAAVAQEVAALVPTYLASQSKQVVAAREQLAHRDFDSLRNFGHNLKGTGRGYGFPEIERIGRELEQAAQENSEQSIAQGLDALDLFVTDAASRQASVPVA